MLKPPETAKKLQIETMILAVLIKFFSCFHPFELNSLLKYVADKIKTSAACEYIDEVETDRVHHMFVMSFKVQNKYIFNIYFLSKTSMGTTMDGVTDTIMFPSEYISSPEVYV